MISYIIILHPSHAFNPRESVSKNYTRAGTLCMSYPTDVLTFKYYEMQGTYFLYQRKKQNSVAKAQKLTGKLFFITLKMDLHFYGTFITK